MSASPSELLTTRYDFIIGPKMVKKTISKMTMILKMASGFLINCLKVSRQYEYGAVDNFSMLSSLAPMTVKRSSTLW